jgi:hypothetical protein
MYGPERRGPEHHAIEKNPEKLGINGKNFCVLCVLNLFFW